MKIQESKSRIFKGLRGWTGETVTTVNGQTFKICTMKRHSGKISTSAQACQVSDGDHFTSVSFSPFKDKNIQLNSYEGKATEKKVKEIHFEALAIFDQKAEAGEIVGDKEQLTPQKFDIIFLDGYDSYKGSQGNKWVVYDIEETQFGTNYKCIEIDTLTKGVKDHVKPFSQKFGIGLYFEPGYKFEGTEEELNNCILDSFEAQRKRDEEEKAAKIREEVRAEEAENELKKTYKHLTPITDGYDYKEVKANLVKDLKHNFPGVKFSVKKRGYSSYTVEYIDGPAYSKVEEVCNKYQSYSTDYSGDYYDHTPDDFNNVFGGLKFLFVTRNYSDEVKALREDFNKRFDFEPSFNHDYFWMMIQKNDITGKIKSIEEKENFTGSIEDSYYLTFEEDKEEPKQAPVKTEGLDLVDYSEKAIALTGDTKPLKDQLKELGGRFNPRLKCGPGWIFSKKRETEIKKAFNL